MVVITLALDGFDKDLFQLPEFGNIRDLYRNRPASALQSTLPALTPSAFVSMQTGKDVGKHGVSGFLRYDGTTVRPYVGSDIKDKTFYEILSEQGKKCFLLSMPYSNPPRISGDVVYDWLSVGKSHVHSCIHPTSLFDSFPELYNYQIFPERANNLSEHMVSIKKSSEALKRIIQQVVDTKRYDFNFFLIRATDWIQHSLLKQIMEGEKSDRVRVALETFSIIDETVKYVEEKIRNNDSLIIMSDHGFTTYKRRFYINDWLKQNGYLATSSGTTDLVEKTRYPFMFDNPVNPEKIKHMPGLLSKILREHRNLMKAAGYLARHFQHVINTRFVISQPIDLDKSMAFAVEEGAGTIFLNKNLLSEGQSEDLKKEIMSKLSSIKEIETHDSKVLYGPSVSNTVPDIYLTSSKYGIRRGLVGTVFSDIYQNYHRQEAVLILSGEAFEKPPVNPRMMDLAPTILHISNCAVPDDMQGRVLAESLSSSAEVAKRSVRYMKSSFTEVEETLSEEEQLVIEGRLKSLGYI